jgi:hypothetical protein
MDIFEKVGKRFQKAFALVMVTAVLINCEPARSESSGASPDKPANGKSQNIMLALLLDTSNSMDGLIDQAKSQLWKVVNELAAAKCADGARPVIKIALYEYGNDNLNASEGYVRLVSNLTTDLDLISEKLFALKTNGGNEYCGYVINKSLAQLEWSTSEADLKMIFIAGNEPFSQGETPYRTACLLAKEKDVVVNTIFCGGFEEGIGTSWKSGADLTGGTYMSIEQDRKTVYVPTPYDETIDALNSKLNDTYIYYGSSGASKKEMQVIQDNNAESYSRSNKVERTVSKSTHAYKNSTWDLVDAAKDDANVVATTEEKNLPQEMKGMNAEQRKAYVAQKSSERAKIQNEILNLSEKRKQYIAEHTSETEKETMLDGVMINAIKERAKTKKLDF